VTAQRFGIKEEKHHHQQIACDFYVILGLKYLVFSHRNWGFFFKISGVFA